MSHYIDTKTSLNLKTNRSKSHDPRIAPNNPRKNRMTLPLVIINPESAGGSTRETWPRIASDLRTHFGSFNCGFTERAGQGIELAAEAARKGAKLIIACGGDGTISEVANGILQSGKNVELGIIPSGTGGDFRRTLEIPSRTRDAARILRIGRTVRIDVGRVSFVDRNG